MPFYDAQQELVHLCLFLHLGQHFYIDSLLTKGQVLPLVLVSHSNIFSRDLRGPHCSHSDQSLNLSLAALTQSFQKQLTVLASQSMNPLSVDNQSRLDLASYLTFQSYKAYRFFCGLQGPSHLLLLSYLHPGGSLISVEYQDLSIHF